MKKTLQEAFVLQAHSTPNDVALVFKAKKHTYKELNERSNEIANHLRLLSIPKNSIIGLSLNRGPELIAAMLGILKAGHCYLPLDSAYPSERLNYMFTQSKASALICDEDSAQLFENVERLVSINNIQGSKEDCVVPGDNVYVIYTSGSTGLPKGVLLGQKALSNLLEWQSRTVINGKTIQFAPISFDVHFQEIFGTLLMGETLYLVSEKERMDLFNLLKIVESEGINRLFLPFVALEQMAKLAVKNNLFPASLSEVVTAGEQLRINENIKTFFKHTKAKLHNQYGPSETHVCVAKTLEDDIEFWPTLPSIGLPIDGANILILDENKQPAREGELYVGGESLSSGYVNDSKRTSERFLNINQTTFYKTGDLVRVNDDEDLEFVARLDGQIKIRGHRVELGEIEKRTQDSFPNVQVCACVKTLTHGEKIICIYIKGEFKESEIRQHLLETLPDYMQPRFIVALESFPLTPSGKLNRNALPLPENKRGDLESEYVEASKPLEKQISLIWKRLLTIDKVGLNDKFFDLGGSSLLAMDLVQELKEIYPEIVTAELFEAATVAQQAKLLSSKKETKSFSRKIKAVDGDIAIVSMTGRFPGANSVEELWEMLFHKKQGVEKFTETELHPSIDRSVLKNKNYVLATGEYQDCKRFDAAFFGMTPREAQLMDPQQRKFLELSWEALELAGINPRKCKQSIGVFAGSANNTYQKNLLDHQDKISEFGDFNVMLANEKDYIATRVAYKLGLNGPAISMHTGCSTSLVAIVQAVEAIRNGHCEIALAGGISIDGQEKTGYLHQDGAIYSADGTCRPYSADATGTVFTNGAGVLVLMPKELAIEKAHEILGVIKGVGINNDGNDKMSFTAPSIQGQTEAILRAFSDCDVKPEDVVYIEGHGTATPVGDPIEVAALSRAFETIGANKNHKCLLGSVKSNLGHLTAAAGVTGVIKACLALKHKTVPASLGIEGTNPEIDFESSWFTPVKENEEIKPGSCIGVSSFGVGGTNAHVLIKDFNQEQSSTKENSEELFLLSAKTQESLKDMQQELDSKLKNANFADTSFTLTSRDEFGFRSVRTTNSKWSKIQKGSAKKLIFMFPGQGSQYVGMGQQLMEAYPSFKEDFEYCCSMASKYMNRDLMAVILGSDEQSRHDALNNTYYTQPAILIFEYCVGKLLNRFGIEADGFIGHSIGELCACVFNEVLTIEDAIKVVSKRSELMSKIEHGSMLSVSLPQEEVESLLPLNIQIAAVNSRQSSVIAGPIEDIERFAKLMSEKDVATKMLHTSHAFHSEMMNPMIEEFKSFVKTIKFSPPKKSMISTVTGDVESEIFCNPNYWAEHVARAVMFAPSISKLIDKDVVFLEVGPRTTLMQLGKAEAIHKKKQASFLSVSARETSNELQSFLMSIGQLWQEGLNFNKDLLFEGRGPRIVPTVTYAFGGKEHWLNMKSVSKQTNENKNIKQIERGEAMQLSAELKLKEKIVEVIEAASGIDLNEFSDETSFFEMGMDSLFLTQVALKLKNEFKQDISFRQLTEEYDDIQKLTTFLASNVKMENFAPQVCLETETETRTYEEMELPYEQAPPSNSEGVEALVKDQLNIMKLQLAMLGKAPGKRMEKTIHSETIEKPKPKVIKEDGTKKTFGAMAKIDSKKTIMDEKAKSFISNFVKDYNKKTAASKRFTQDNRKNHADPRVVTGFRPESKEMVYPIVTRTSRGQKLVDLDGNEYVDMLCGFGSNFFGNNNREINEAIKRQVDQGMEIGPQHPLVSDVSKLINELTGNGRSAFCNTGSEAVLGAMRLARTVSGKETIVSFNGSYHGINDEVIVRTSSKGKALPAAPGINSNSVQNMVVLDYGTDESLEKIQELCEKGELAAVMVEPVQSRRCDFHPKEFLQNIRAITLKHDVCLIFDEVITGFRIHPGGAQAYFDVKADLCTYGKIVGGGMPIGVLSGKSSYMDALDGGHWQFGDDSIPTVGVTYFAGTFVRHPLALAAAKKALEIVKGEGIQGLEKLNSKAQRWVDDINSFCEKVGSNLRFANCGSLLKPKWDGGDYEYSDLFFAQLRMLGVHQYDGFPWFVNLAHTEADLAFVKDTIKEVVTKLQESGLMPSNGVKLAKKEHSSITPPVDGARLGKDKDGNPGWFVPHPEKQGQYYQLQ